MVSLTNDDCEKEQEECSDITLAAPSMGCMSNYTTEEMWKTTSERGVNEEVLTSIAVQDQDSSTELQRQYRHSVNNGSIVNIPPTTRKRSSITPSMISIGGSPGFKTPTPKKKALRKKLETKTLDIRNFWKKKEELITDRKRLISIVSQPVKVVWLLWLFFF